MQHTYTAHEHTERIWTFKAILGFLEIQINILKCTFFSENSDSEVFLRFRDVDLCSETSVDRGQVKRNIPYGLLKYFDSLFMFIEQSSKKCS